MKRKTTPRERANLELIDKTYQSFERAFQRMVRSVHKMEECRRIVKRCQRTIKREHEATDAQDKHPSK